MIASRTCIFKYGYGEKKRYDALRKLNIPRYPFPINFQLKALYSKYNNCEVENVVENVYSFESPLKHLLREGEKIVEFKLHRCVKKKNKFLVVHLPAAGQQDYDDRFKMLGKFCLEREIDYLCPIAPIYFSRRSENQHHCNATYQSVVDSPCTYHAFVQEIRSLVNKCFDEFGYDGICITGLSMGGFVLCHLISMPILSKRNLERKKKLCAVPFMGFMSLSFPNFFEEIVRDSIGNIQFPNFLSDIIDNDSLDVVEKVNIVIQHFQLTPMKDLIQIPNEVKVIRILHSSYDRIISKEEQKLVNVRMRKISKRNKIKKGNFSIERIKMGHSGSFVYGPIVEKYQEEVLKAITKMNRI